MKKKINVNAEDLTGSSAWGGLRLILEPDNNNNTTNKPNKLGLA